MKSLTKRQALTECSKMWRWMAAHPNAFKLEYLNSIGIDVDADNCPESCCYLCEYDKQNGHQFCNNKSCLVKWENNDCMDSEFQQWQTAKDRQDKDKQTYYATLIADLADEALYELAKWERNIKFGPFIVYIGWRQCMDCHRHNRHSAIINISYSHEKPYYHSIFRIVKHGRSISRD